MEIVVADPFDTADLYSCERECDSLCHETPDAAIAEVVEYVGPPLECVTVYAWKRKTIGLDAGRAFVSHVEDALHDFMDDNEFTGEDPLDITPEVRTALDALATSITTMVPYACELVGKRVMKVEPRHFGMLGGGT